MALTCEVDMALTKEDRKKLFKYFMSDALLSVEEVIGTLDDVGFFTAPASTKYHGNYEGGLFDHSYAVACKLCEMTDKMELSWERAASPKIVGMLHDVCKCDSYIKNMDDTYSHNKKKLLAGHGDASVILCQAIECLPALTTEEILCIRYHMGAYEDPGVWDNYGEAISRYENVLWTHTADMYASKVEGT